MGEKTRTGAVLILILLAGIAMTSAQESAEGQAEEQTEEQTEVKEVIQSLSEDRREILLYGIDTQVLQLVEDLEKEQNVGLVGEVHAALKLTRNPKIRSAIFGYFEAIEYRNAEDEALEIIEDFWEQSTEVLLSAIRYLTKEPDSDFAPLLEPLLESPDQEVVRIAVKGIGLSGDEESVYLLLDYLDDPDFPQNIKPEIILALGDLKDTAAIEPLIDILEDTAEDPTWRRYACSSLGKIGDLSVLPVIENVLFDEDANLRSYALGALRYFESDRVIPMLMTGLKDSFWRVRISAAQGLGEKGAAEAESILIFKAEKDPEMNVREEAVRALGAIATTGAFEFLRSFYEKDVTSQGLRFLSAKILSEQDLENSIDVFTRVIEKNWEKDNSRILERSAYYLSLAESPNLETLYSRFLDSGELVIIIYGIRGAARNKVVSLREAVEKLSEEGNHRSIRKAALAALEDY